MAVRSGTWATVDGGTKTSGPGAMDADALCPGLLDEWATTSLFAQPEWCWRLRTLTMIPPTTGCEI
jgi:hypothetical protein